MKLFGVPSGEAHEYYATVQPFLEGLDNRGEADPDDLWRDVMASDRQAWLAVDNGGVKALALTQIYGKRLKICRVTHVTGTGLKAWVHFVDEIEQWARSIGCARFEGFARPGWERLTKSRGFKKTHVLIEKDL